MISAFITVGRGEVSPGCIRVIRLGLERQHGGGVVGLDLRLVRVFLGDFAVGRGP